MKVELQLVENKVIYLETKNTIIGTIEALDSNRRIITFKANNSDVKTYVISSSVDIDIEGVSSPDLADLSKHNLVEIRLEENIVSKINVQKTLIYQVTNLYTNSKELKVNDKNGASKYLNVTNRVELVMPDKTSASLEALTVGTIIRATFLGYKLTKVETIPTAKGRITGINTLTNSITFQPVEGSTTSYTFNSKSEVLNGLQKYYQLNALAVGDRVSIREKEDGGFTFSIMKKASVKYQGLSDDGKKIITYKEPFVFISYDLAANVYIHSGNLLLTTRNLVKDNQLDLYFQDDLVSEVDKK